MELKRQVYSLYRIYISGQIAELYISEKNVFKTSIGNISSQREKPFHFLLIIDMTVSTPYRASFIRKRYSVVMEVK